MSDPKITLEYIRTLIWPAFALAVLLLYQNDISGMISRGVELDILGVTIKGASGEEVEKLLTREQQLRDAMRNLETRLREQAQLNNRLVEENARLLAETESLQAQLIAASIESGGDISAVLPPPAAGVGGWEKEVYQCAAHAPTRSLLCSMGCAINRKNRWVRRGYEWGNELSSPG